MHLLTFLIIFLLEKVNIACTALFDSANGFDESNHARYHQ